MADPLSILGDVSAGLELVAVAAKALLATARLIKDFKETPKKLASLLSDLDASTTRLNFSFDETSICSQYLASPQLGGISQCIVALYTVLQDIRSLLEPLGKKRQATPGPIRHLWNNVVALKIESELPAKLDRLNRLNLEVIRELGTLSLESQRVTNELILSNNESTQKQFASMETHMGLMQLDFKRLALAVKQTTQNNVVFPTSCSMKAWRIAQVMESTQPCVLSPADPSTANLDHILFSIRTFYTRGNFDSTSTVIRSKFWEDTYLGIYWVKVAAHSQRGSSESCSRGLRLLKKSTTGAIDVLAHGTSTMLLELLSTLAPVNTAASPYVHDGLMAYLHELAQEQLPKSHPITLVLRRLRMESPGNDVTLRALSFIFERLRAILGPLHELTLLGAHRLCETLRRNGDYNEALKVATGVIGAIRGTLGLDLCKNVTCYSRLSTFTWTSVTGSQH
ncbi:hypothetical protein PG997_002869 [Apiospora hydei]|uniref:Fungal N-terminal domain-containing protein n=1 Tax=Apiospora hydei TaxID=1337664 RepID=A0ABR1WXL3_9PEZI